VPPIGQYANVFERDARDLSFIPDKSYDAVFCAHLIEHMSKMDGLLFLREMERIARMIVVVETPNGYLPQGAADGNEFQRHLSGWEPYEFEMLGYSVVGIFGCKYFKYSGLGRLFRHLTDGMIRHRPSSASTLLASKRMTGTKHPSLKASDVPTSIGGSGFSLKLSRHSAEPSAEAVTDTVP